MNSERRLPEIRRELETALDSEEEYLEEGAMGTYFPRSCASDAAEQLASLFKASEPTVEEIACCVEAISNPERIRKGRSKQLLLHLREASHPILDALAHSNDPQLRIFALEIANTSTRPPYFVPLYEIVKLGQQLLNDPDENVRVAAILASRQTIARDALLIEINFHKRTHQGWLDFFDQLLARLSDPSAKVRTAAAEILHNWAASLRLQSLGRFTSYLDREAWDILVEHENDVEARKELASKSWLCDKNQNWKINWQE